MGRVLPLTAASTLTIVAGLADYAAPVDAIGFIASDWVTRNAGRNPWDPCFVSVVQQPALVRTAAGKLWRFSPLPDCATDRKSVVQGRRVAVRVGAGGRRSIKNKTKG